MASFPADSGQTWLVRNHEIVSDLGTLIQQNDRQLDLLDGRANGRYPIVPGHELSGTIVAT